MGHKLLLVDRGSGVAARLCEQLGRAGHEAVCVAGIVEALAAVERTHPDLVLIDDGGAEAATTSLCEKIKGSPALGGTIVIVLADHVSRVVDEPAERARRIGCDRILDINIAGEELSAICAELLESRPRATPAAPASAPTKEANRDAPSAEAFDAESESALAGASALADDGGRDIEDHLDSLFASAGRAPAAAARAGAPAPEPASRIVSPSVPPTAAAAPPRPERTSTDPVLPRVPSRPAGQPRSATPRATGAATASRVSPPPAGRNAQATPPTGASRPAASPPPRQAAQPAAAQPRPSSPSSTRTVREAPKALAHLREPRMATPRPAEPTAFRFPVRRVGIGALVAVVGSAAVWFVFFTGRSPAPVAPVDPVAEIAPPVVAQVVPEPAPVAESPDLPAPPPFGDSTSEVDFAAPTVPPEPPAEASEPAPSLPPPAAPAARRATPEAVPGAPAPARTAPEIATATPPPSAETHSGERGAMSAASVAAVPAAPAPAEPEASAPAEPQAPEPVEAPAEPPAEPPAAEPPPDPAPTSPVIVPPEVLERVAPVYSPAALKKVDKPVVVLRVLVDEQGRIGRVIVDQGIPGSELEAAAISAVLRWRFRPGTENGVPAKAWTSARFTFER